MSKEKVAKFKEVKETEKVNEVIFNNKNIELKELTLNEDIVRLIDSKIDFHKWITVNNSLNTSNPIEHVIINDTLCILTDSSKLVIDDKYNLADISYVEGDNLYKVVNNVIILNDSIIKTSYFSIKGVNFIIKSSIKSENEIRVNNTYLSDVVLYNNKSLECNNAYIKHSTFNSPYVELNNINCTNYHLTVTDLIRIITPNYCVRNGLTIYGSIKSLNINMMEYFPFDLNLKLWYSENEPIDLIVKNRIDNGYFSSITPIPFMRTTKGILVGSKHFTLDQISQLFYSLKNDLFSNVNTMTLLTKDQEETYKSLLDTIIRSSSGYNKDCRPHPDLTKRNEEVFGLCYQIYSRLKTITELDMYL